MKRTGYIVDSYRLNPKQRMENMVFQEQIIKIVEDQLLFKKKLSNFYFLFNLLKIIERISADDASYRVGVWAGQTALDSGHKGYEGWPSIDKRQQGRVARRRKSEKWKRPRTFVSPARHRSLHGRRISGIGRAIRHVQQSIRHHHWTDRSRRTGLEIFGSHCSN